MAILGAFGTLTLDAVAAELIEVVGPPRQRRLQRTNAGLQASHRRLQAAIAAVESPATVFDQPDYVAHTQTAELLEAEFPFALHDYATTGTFAIAAMTSPEP